MRHPPTVVKVFAITGLIFAIFGGLAWSRGGPLGFESGDAFFSLGAPLTTAVFKLFEARHLILTDLDNSWAIPFMAFVLIIQFVIWGVMLHFATRAVRGYLQKHA
jgi:hypothetical protein